MSINSKNLLLASAGNSVAEPVNYFLDFHGILDDHTYGDFSSYAPSTSSSISPIVLSDGGAICVSIGPISFPGVSYPSVFFTRVDITGEPMWMASVQVNGNNSIDPKAVFADSADNTYFICESTGLSTGLKEVFFVKVDSLGTVVFNQRVYASTNLYILSNGIQYPVGKNHLSPDESYYYDFCENPGIAGLGFLRFDLSSGSVLLLHSMGTSVSNFVSCRHVVDSTGNVYYVAGLNGGNIAYHLKFNSFGTLLWQKYYPSNTINHLVLDEQEQYLLSCSSSKIFKVSTTDGSIIQTLSHDIGNAVSVPIPITGRKLLYPKRGLIVEIDYASNTIVSEYEDKKNIVSSTAPALSLNRYRFVYDEAMDRVAISAQSATDIPGETTYSLVNISLTALRAGSAFGYGREIKYKQNSPNSFSLSVTTNPTLNSTPVASTSGNVFSTSTTLVSGFYTTGDSLFTSYPFAVAKYEKQIIETWSQNSVYMATVPAVHVDPYPDYTNAPIWDYPILSTGPQVEVGDLIVTMFFSTLDAAPIGTIPFTMSGSGYTELTTVTDPANSYGFIQLGYKVVSAVPETVISVDTSVIPNFSFGFLSYLVFRNVDPVSPISTITVTNNSTTRRMSPSWPTLDNEKSIPVAAGAYWAPSSDNVYLHRAGNATNYTNVLRIYGGVLSSMAGGMFFAMPEVGTLSVRSADFTLRPSSDTSGYSSTILTFYVKGV